MKIERCDWMAGLIAPLPAAVAGGIGTRFGHEVDLVLSAGMSLIFYPCVLVFAVIIGGPVFYGLKARGWANPFVLTVAGAIAGGLISIALAWDGPRENVVIMAIYGGLTAATFWISRRLCRRGA